ncbi:unnamed protein product, partial [Symbiodinium microadriaticum]
MLCYVDDLILCGSPEAIKLVTDTLNQELKIKETGRITPDGGKIVFLGREIERVGEHLRMRVPPKYMEGLFETDFCKDLKVLSSPPDIVKIIEKGRAEPEKDDLLTEAAAMRYRAVLGRIAWWGQSRPDLGADVIRFLKGQYLCWQYYEPGSEAELRAILTAVQESEGIATLIGQLADAKVELVLHTDSSSAKAVLLNRGLSRRVRQLDIAVCYLQERIQEVGSLKVFWCPTSAMVADILTKCLSMDLFQRHQGALGIFEDETVQKVHMICGMRLDGDLFSDRSFDGSSFESEWIPEIGSMGTSVEKVTAVQNQDAPFWCKTCKWLFKNEGAHGLNKTPEGFSCGKCKNEITVMGSAAQHAFNMREKDKTKRWGLKGEGTKGEGKDKAPITPAPQNEGDVPLTPAPSGAVDSSGGTEQPDPLLPWFPDLSDQMGTPEWYKDMHDVVP